MVGRYDGASTGASAPRLRSVLECQAKVFGCFGGTFVRDSPRYIQHPPYPDSSPPTPPARCSWKRHLDEQQPNALGPSETPPEHTPDAHLHRNRPRTAQHPLAQRLAPDLLSSHVGLSVATLGLFASRR